MNARRCDLRVMRSAAYGDVSLQAGPAVALWGDIEVQEGVRMCPRARLDFGLCPWRLSLFQVKKFNLGHRLEFCARRRAAYAKKHSRAVLCVLKKPRPTRTIAKGSFKCLRAALVSAAWNAPIASSFSGTARTNFTKSGRYGDCQIL